jgi:hypothetical protein
MTIVAFRKSEQNEAALDPWSLVHLACGLAFGLMGYGFKPSMTAAVAFDVVEYGFESTELGRETFGTSGPESMANVAADLGLFGVGWYMGNHWNKS